MNPPRTPVDVDSFTSIGKTVLQRAKLEFERRFMNNTDDLKTFDEIIEHDDSDSEMNATDTVRLVISSDRVKAAAYLDMRLLLKLTVMDEKEWKRLKALLQNYYVEFFNMLQSVRKEEEQGKGKHNRSN